MLNKKSKRKYSLLSKSVTDLYNILGPLDLSNYVNIRAKKSNKTMPTRKAMYDEYSMFNQSQQVYMTSERYHNLNTVQSSDKTIIKSTSTFFYDLDDLAKRHSFNCLTENLTKSNCLRVMDVAVKNTFEHKNKNTIVQECATQMRHKPRDSLEILSKKTKKKNASMPNESSGINLRDNDQDDKINSNNIPRPQKIWSYAKYNVDYTNIAESKRKHRKKDKIQRTENPCPCQLFSYACPCSDSKSLPQLADNEEFKNYVDQKTSTVNKEDIQYKILNMEKNTNNKNVAKENMETNVSFTDFANIKYNSSLKDVSEHEIKNNEFNVNNNSTNLKKPLQIICPKCKEVVDIINIIEKQPSTHYVVPSPNPHVAECTYTENNRSEIRSYTNGCNHEPKCEMTPICQILPNSTFRDNKFKNEIVQQVHATYKAPPRIIRLTKACRHQPPCTVTPSCQRENALKTNCEFIPPCMHRPRCINLPLCIPIPKDLCNYEQSAKNKTAYSDCSNKPHYKLISNYHQNYRDNKLFENQNIYNNRYGTDYASQYRNTTMKQPYEEAYTTQLNNCYNRENEDPSISCSCCIDNKSCQCSSCKIEPIVDESIIYIRDVGCQFRSKSESPKQSIFNSKTSSVFDVNNLKLGNYYTDIQNLQHEHKYTNPVIDKEVSSSSTIKSSEIDDDSHCSHRTNYRNSSSIKRNVSPYVAAFSSMANNNNYKSTGHREPDTINGEATSNFTKRASVIKNKHKQMRKRKRR